MFDYCQDPNSYNTFDHIPDGFDRFSDGWNACDAVDASDERSEILEWLSPLEPGMRHRSLQTDRVPNVGGWLLQTEEFQSWSDVSRQDESGDTTMFCYGMPGVGKTYITSLVIDTLRDQASEKNIAVAGFYFDFVAQKEQSPTSVLGALLKEIVGGLEEIPEEIVKVYHHRKDLDGGRGPRLPELVKMLRTTTSSQSMFLCVDALDECAETCQLDVLNSLQMVLQGSPSTRLFLTGRVHIMDDIRRRFNNRVTVARVVPGGGDITQYLCARLEDDPEPGAMNEGLRAEILRRIPETASEIFSLVSLSIETILSEPTIYRRRQRLKAMTNGSSLGDAYGATVRRIMEQDGGRAGLGMTALMWVSHSERPLRVDELCHALAVEVGSADLDPENVPSVGALLNCCQGLLTVDKEASTVRLIHLTLREYLSTSPDLFARAHSTIAESCLAYLNFQRFKNFPPSDLSDPFLGYSSIYWGTHAKRELSDCAKSLALELFDDYEHHASAQFLLKHISKPNFFDDGQGFSSFNGLHCASFFGIVEVVAALVEMNGYDVNQRDCMGNTPLIWAAENGHEGVVSLLLWRGDVDPDKPDYRGQTPLSRAAGNGCEGVVRLLLRRGDVNPDRPNDGGQTPLSQAAENGHEGVVRLLLRRDDVNPDRPTDRGQTPLSQAAENGHEGVVRLLLEREDVCPDRPDHRGQTPLSRAAGNGCEGVARLLLQREDVNADQPDYEGLTPLSWAVKNGCEGVVRLLLERNDVDPDRPDTMFGQTPLSSAVENGHEGVVRLLLERKDVDPNRQDNILGHTPLLWAAGNGYEGVVKLLLGRHDVDPDRGGNDGRTPLSRAAWNGHEGVVKLLLDREDVRPNRPDAESQTPLLGAALNGHEGVVRLLLDRYDVNPNWPDMENQTPLSRAADNGHEAVVKLLLGREDVDPDRPDTEGQTPLSRAAYNGHEGVVKLLLCRKDVDPNRPDMGGQTPLLRAAKEGHERVVDLLQEREDVAPGKPVRSSHTPPLPPSTVYKRARLVLR